MQEFLLFIGLFFSLYGLSCAISSFVMWLVIEKEEKGKVLLIQVSNETAVKTKISCGLRQIKNSGLHNFVSVIVVDCGLPAEKIESVSRYCVKKGIGFCKTEELSGYFKKSSFQKSGNKV